MYWYTYASSFPKGCSFHPMCGHTSQEEASENEKTESQVQTWAEKKRDKKKTKKTRERERVKR